jgi:hypothetical protein
MLSVIPPSCTIPAKLPPTSSSSRRPIRIAERDRLTLDERRVQAGGGGHSEVQVHSVWTTVRVRAGVRREDSHSRSLRSSPMMRRDARWQLGARVVFSIAAPTFPPMPCLPVPPPSRAVCQSPSPSSRSRPSGGVDEARRADSSRWLAMRVLALSALTSMVRGWVGVERVRSRVYVGAAAGLRSGRSRLLRLLGHRRAPAERKKRTERQRRGEGAPRRDRAEPTRRETQERSEWVREAHAIGVDQRLLTTSAPQVEPTIEEHVVALNLRDARTDEGDGFTDG